MSTDLESIIGEMTVARLAQLGGQSVATIAAFALSPAGASAAVAKNGASRPAAKASRAKAPRGKASSARKSGSGSDFDTKVLETIRSAGGPVRSVDIENAVGGTAESRRAALRRLVAAKKLKRSGVARATRYEAR